MTKQVTTMKKLLLIFLSITFIAGVKAKSYATDLENFDTRSTSHYLCEDDYLLSGDYIFIDEDSPSKFRFPKLIVPSSPIFLGSLTLYVTYAERLDMSISDKISSGHGQLHFDDYLQYSPALIMWGLNAFGGPNLKPYHKFKQQTTILAMSAITSLVLVQGTKQFVGRNRPDTGASNSFPSGHTATAFLCAEMLHQEYGQYSPWISILGYSIAATTGYMRVYNERHYIGDIVAGAGVGILSARLGYWFAPKINNWLWGSTTGYAEDSYTTAITPCTIGQNVGVNFSLVF